MTLICLKSHFVIKKGNIMKSVLWIVSHHELSESLHPYLYDKQAKFKWFFRETGFLVNH